MILLPFVIHKLNIAPFLVFQVMRLISGLIETITSVTVLEVINLLIGGVKYCQPEGHKVSLGKTIEFFNFLSQGTGL